MGLWAWPYTVDDAYIVGRVARTIASGGGYGMNRFERADAVTGPLSLVPGILATWFTLDAVNVAKMVGLIGVTLAACLVVRAALRRYTSVWPAFACGAVLVLEPTLGVWGQAGLETGIATLAFTYAVVLAWEARDARYNSIAIPTLVGAVAWLRPELVPAAFGVVLMAAPTLPRPFASIVGALCGVASVAIFRIALFGSPIPLSFFAKPGEIGEGALYVMRAVVVHSTLAGLVLVWIARERALKILLVVHVLAVLLSGGDWMPGYRLLAPALPLFALVFADGVANLIERGRRVLAAALVVLSFVLPTLDVAVELPLARAAGAARVAGGDSLRHWLDVPHRRAALVDVGYAAYQTQAEVIDLGGVTDNQIGRLPGAYLDKQVRESLLRERDPNLLLLHSAARPEVRDGELVSFRGYGVEHRVARMNWVHQAFRVEQVIEYSPTYYYVVLVRRERPLLTR